MKNKQKTGRALIQDANDGCGPLIGLDQRDIASLVATYAPYGRQAREEFFRLLRETADGRHPCYRE